MPTGSRILLDCYSFGTGEFVEMHMHNRQFAQSFCDNPKKIVTNCEPSLLQAR